MREKMKAPIDYDFSEKTALVVGDGPVGRRRADKLVSYGCKLKVSSLKTNPFDPAMLKGVDIVVAATDDEKLNDRILKAAGEAGVPLLNSVGFSAYGNFSFPGSFCEDGLTVSVSTGGASPGFTALFTEHIRKELKGGWLRRFELMKKARMRCREKGEDPKILEDLSMKQLEDYLEK